MLNRRILRIKAFKVLYACAENPDIQLKEALDNLEISCEATRDLYLQMLAVIPALTSEASKRIEAARSKFQPTEEDLHPNLKFVRNGVSAILEQDPDFQKFLQKKKLSWANSDVFLYKLYETLKSRPYYQQYMQEPEQSLKGDSALWEQVFREEFEDNDALWTILEDQSIYWSDDLPYALGCCIHTLEDITRTGKWDLPPLYQSDSRDFVRSLLSATYGRFKEYFNLVASSVSQWDRERLYTTDTILIAMGLAEAETFPEIPIRVTINEYVEISKYYSTPKSRSFVNGLLDRLIKDRVEKGIIRKTV